MAKDNDFSNSSSSTNCFEKHLWKGWRKFMTLAIVVGVFLVIAIPRKDQCLEATEDTDCSYDKGLYCIERECAQKECTAATTTDAAGCYRTKNCDATKNKCSECTKSPNSCPANFECNDDLTCACANDAACPGADSYCLDKKCANKECVARATETHNAYSIYLKSTCP